MNAEGIERIVVSDFALHDRHREVANQAGQEADQESRHRRDKARTRSDGDETVRGGRNDERFPLYWRLDLSAERRFEVGGATLKPYLNIVNVFNRKNVFLYTLDADTDPPTVKGGSQFPLLPSFGLRLEW